MIEGKNANFTCVIEENAMQLNPIHIFWRIIVPTSSSKNPFVNGTTRIPGIENAYLSSDATMFMLDNVNRTADGLIVDCRGLGMGGDAPTSPEVKLTVNCKFHYKYKTDGTYTFRLYIQYKLQYTKVI